MQLGGPVTAESVLSAVYDGFRLATLLCCIGAANTLANPKRALRVLPAALYELGVTITVAVTVAPQLVESVQRVRRARKLRGDTTRGRRAVRGIAMPVLHDALDRSFQLAAAMDSRGYGRTGAVPARVRRLTAALLLAGLLGLCLGTYGLLDTSTPRLLGAPMLAFGLALCAAGLFVGGRRVHRTRYRPDPWAFAEWCTALLGSGRGDRDDRRREPQRVRAQSVDLPARVADAADRSRPLAILFALLPAVAHSPAAGHFTPSPTRAASRGAPRPQPVGARA